MTWPRWCQMQLKITVLAVLLVHTASAHVIWPLRFVDLPAGRSNQNHRSLLGRAELPLQGDLDLGYYHAQVSLVRHQFPNLQCAQRCMSKPFRHFK
jgi:hypothetical protein